MRKTSTTFALIVVMLTVAVPASARQTGPSARSLPADWYLKNGWCR